jgi:hypothetical protein
MNGGAFNEHTKWRINREAVQSPELRKLNERRCVNEYANWRINREAVTPQSPGLPRFGGYPGKQDMIANPEGVAS